MVQCDTVPRPQKGNLKHHDGHHPQIQGRVLARYSAEVGGILRRIQRAIRACEDSGQGECNIGFQCNAGRHRSVAVAELVGTLVQQKGYRARVEHRALAMESWKRCWCELCGENRPTRDNMDAMSRLW